jgi:glycosyltransferase involved in cell wall biosynthesis
MRKLQVCHLGKYYPPAPGGIESHVQTLAHAQAALGANVRVLCVNHVNRRGEDLTWCRHGRSETVEELDGLVRVTRIGRSASLAKLDICPELRHMLRTLEHSDTDILHLHTPNPTMLLALATVKPLVPLVITHHSDVIRQRVLKYVIRPVEHLVYRRASRISQTSPLYVRESSLLQAHGARLSALPLGVDLEMFLRPSPSARDLSAALSQTHGQPLWLMVGRCVYYKAFHVAIKALAHVPGKLLVIGNGPLEWELHRLAERVGVADRVIWRRYVAPDELVASYHAATALWFPSNARSEAYGLVQVEAMACGCPVINSEITGSGVPWVSPHEVTGLTVPLNDPLALAHAANRLVDEPALRTRLAESAATRAVEEFDHLKMGQRSLEIYQRALTGTSAAPALAPVPATRLAPAPTVPIDLDNEEMVLAR